MVFCLETLVNMLDLFMHWGPKFLGKMGEVWGLDCPEHQHFLVHPFVPKHLDLRWSLHPVVSVSKLVTKKKQHETYGGLGLLLIWKPHSRRRTLWQIIGFLKSANC